MKKYIFTFVGVIVIAAIIALVAFKSFNSNIETAQRDPKFEQLPPIISQIKTLEVVNAGNPDAMVSIDIKNNSPKPIVSINLISGDKKLKAGHMVSGSLVEPPLIIGKPFEIFTIDMPLGRVINGLPIRINGVI